MVSTRRVKTRRDFLVFPYNMDVEQAVITKQFNKTMKKPVLVL